MSNSRLVYSTAGARNCPSCRKPLKKCSCAQTKTQTPPRDAIIRISRETKGRKGKGVTLISGLALTEVELKNLASEMKMLCGCGGSVKTGVIEIQGDHRLALKQLLEQRYDQVKLAGG